MFFHNFIFYILYFFELEKEKNFKTERKGETKWMQ
jgi:hypothetical protein